MSLKTLIKRPQSEVFRRAYIKRRSSITGLYEDDWQEISKDIKSWGKITKQLDTENYNKFRFNSFSMRVTNDEGRYNNSDTDNSLWFGYMSPQRSLVKIEAGLRWKHKDDEGIWNIQEGPGSSWDQSLWDENEWDENSVMFIGIIQGDIFQSSSNEVTLPIKPLLQVFRDFPAVYLRGFDAAGMTASEFVEMVKDQQDVSLNYYFRPFFDNTTTGWDIQATTIGYADLNTYTSAQLQNLSTWDVLERLAQAENFVSYVARDGTFKFQDRTEASATPAFIFNGFGSSDREYGQTIKKIESYGPRVSKYYSRVEVKWREEDTTTSYAAFETSIAVSAGNSPWEFGAKALKIENVWIQTSTVAETIAQNLYNDVGNVRKEIRFVTSFVPHLDLLDKISVNYDSAPTFANSLWDLKDWATDSGEDEAFLTWDKVVGESIKIDGAEFKLLSITVDLDKLESAFEAREI
jgi:hypothetical protein